MADYRFCIGCGKRVYLARKHGLDGGRVGHIKCIAHLRIARNKHLNTHRKPTCRACGGTMRKVKANPGWIRCGLHGITARWPKEETA